MFAEWRSRRKTNGANFRSGRRQLLQKNKTKKTHPSKGRPRREWSSGVVQCELPLFPHVTTVDLFFLFSFFLLFIALRWIEAQRVLKRGIYKTGLRSQKREKPPGRRKRKEEMGCGVPRYWAFIEKRSGKNVKELCFSDMSDTCAPLNDHCVRNRGGGGYDFPLWTLKKHTRRLEGSPVC